MGTSYTAQVEARCPVTIFWNVSHPARAMAAAFSKEPYSRLMVDVADRGRTITTNRAAIAAHTLSRA
jgi:hypothetical protein